MTDRARIRLALRHPRGLRLLRRYIDGLPISRLHLIRDEFRRVPDTVRESCPFFTAVKEILYGG